MRVVDLRLPLGSIHFLRPVVDKREEKPDRLRPTGESEQRASLVERLGGFTD